METPATHEHIRVAVVDAEPPGYEHVPARPLRFGKWELLASPLYATGVAAGDRIRLVHADAGVFKVVKRGGNVCIHFYMDPDHADDRGATDAVATQVAAVLTDLGGTIHGLTAGLFGATVPARVGFPTIEAVFAEAAERQPGAEWEYANVYDPDTGAPLNWWR